MGRDYGQPLDVAPNMDMPDGDAVETATTAFMIVLGSRPASLKRMATKDPLMLDLVLGLLFRFDP